MNHIIKVLLLCTGLFLSLATFAADMNTAKNQGFIGERADGYLGVVDQSAAGDIKALVREINGKRPQTVISGSSINPQRAISRRSCARSMANAEPSTNASLRPTVSRDRKLKC